jgi:hypothetical protein
MLESIIEQIGLTDVYTIAREAAQVRQ